MTLQQLQYVLAVAQEGSITKAARALFKSQPNISNAIRELEEELNIQIFARTPNGVSLTPEGEEFLVQASSITQQVKRLENQYRRDGKEELNLRISIARSSYMIRGISQWIDRNLQGDRPVSIHLAETNTNRVIQEVCSGAADLGIIRIPGNQLDQYNRLLKENRLIAETLMVFPLRIVFREDHPLSRYENIPYEELAAYTEIIHGDDQVPAIQKTQINPGLLPEKHRKVYVYDRGSQINLLENVRGSYMWVSPIPPDMLEMYHMVLKDCSFATVENRDILIYRRENRKHAAIRDCIKYLTAFAQELQKSAEGRENTVSAGPAHNLSSPAHIV